MLCMLSIFSSVQLMIEPLKQTIDNSSSNLCYFVVYQNYFQMYDNTMYDNIYFNKFAQ